MTITKLRASVGLGVSCAMLLSTGSVHAYCGGGAVAAPASPPSGVQPSGGGEEVETQTVTVTEDPSIIKAREHYMAGGRAYNAGDYKTAAREFKTAESMTEKVSSPALDRQLGQVNEKLHKPRVAIKYYQRFLEQHFWGSEADEINARVAALEPEAAKAAPSAGEAADMPPGHSAEWLGYDPFNGPPPKKTITVKKGLPKYWWVGLVTVAGSAIVVGLGVGLSHRNDERFPAEGAAMTFHE
jgi:hypothetical protein